MDSNANPDCSASRMARATTRCDLVSAAQHGDPNARLALDAFCLRVRQGIAAAAVCLEQIDALVFTGEIGNDQPQLREAICTRLAPLGIVGRLDDVVDADALIGGPGTIPVITLTVQEDLQVADETRRVLGWSR